MLIYGSGVLCLTRKTQSWLLVRNHTIMSGLHIPQPALPLPISKPLMCYTEVTLDHRAHHFIITHDMRKWACLNMCRSGVGTFTGTHSMHKNTLTPHTRAAGISRDNPVVTLSFNTRLQRVSLVGDGGRSGN